MSYKGFSIPVSKLNASYDVVVIGAGVGGLICANFLAKNGHSVLVIEQQNKPGGLCSGFQRHGMNFDIGAYHFGGIGNPCSFTGLILSRLAVNLDLVTTDLFSRIHIGDETIAIPCDSQRYSAMLKDRFPREGDAIVRFFSDLSDINRPKVTNSGDHLVKKYEMSTYYQMLDHYFSDEKLKAILSAHWGYVGLPAKQVSALTMCQVLGKFILDGGYVMKGGSQRLPDSLTENLLRQGGQILLSHEVSDILVKNGQAYGVRLDGGHEINGFYLVSNIDAKQTFFKLLPEGCLEENFVAELLGYKESCSIFMIFLILEDAAEILEKIKGWHFESYDALLNKQDFLYLLANSAVRSEKALSNRQTLRITVPIFKQNFNWKDQKNVFENDILAKLTKRYPALANKIVHQESATPGTFQRNTRNSQGAALGWAQTPDQTGRFRLDNRTPIKNLYLTGHWSRQGAGIASVILSGFHTSTQIMRKF